MVVRGLWAGMVLMLVAAPAAGLQRAERLGGWLVEPGEVVQWKGDWIGVDTYMFGWLGNAAPVYGELVLTLPWNLRIGGLAGRFRVKFNTHYGYRPESRYVYRPGYGFREPDPISGSGLPVRLVRVEEMRVLLDGAPYLTIRHPMPEVLKLDFPYPVRELSLRAELSEGGPLRVRVRLPERHRMLARGVDFRKALYLKGPQWPHEGPFFRPPEQKNKKVAVATVGTWGCLTRPELGRVRLARVRVERHPRLEAGEAVEMEVRVHQPVYELLVWSDPFPTFAWSEEDPRFRVRIVCETDRGRRLEKAFEGELPKS